MNTYVYPAVLYENKDGQHYLSIPDLNLLANGDTAEESFTNGKECVKSYFELAAKFNTIIPVPSSFVEISKKYPKNKVVMIDVAVKVNDASLSQEEQDYKNFMKLFFDEDEGGQDGRKKAKWFIGFSTSNWF